jgi:hypothetical protein
MCQGTTSVVPKDHHNHVGLYRLRKNSSRAGRSVRARLQSCRKCCKINAGFSPCGTLFGHFGQMQAFFRSLFGPRGPVGMAKDPGSSLKRPGGPEFGQARFGREAGRLSPHGRRPVHGNPAGNGRAFGIAQRAKGARQRSNRSGQPASARPNERSQASCCASHPCARKERKDGAPTFMLEQGWALSRSAKTRNPTRRVRFTVGP